MCQRLSCGAQQRWTRSQYARPCRSWRSRHRGRARERSRRHRRRLRRPLARASSRPRGRARAASQRSLPRGPARSRAVAARTLQGWSGPCGPSRPARSSTRGGCRVPGFPRATPAGPRG
ncbi:hypothetical protein ACFPRL_30340 [Pseudoclavibacter helvolus]